MAADTYSNSDLIETSIRMIGFSRIQRYIFMESAKSLGTTLSVIALAILLVDTVEQISTIGARADITLLDAFSFSLMKLPSLIEQTMPFALLIAAMMTYRRLSKRAELPVIRASGLSAWSFLAPNAILALFAGIIALTAISPLGSQLTQRYELARSGVLAQNGSKASSAGGEIWLRDGDNFTQSTIHAQAIDQTGTKLINVRFLEEQRIPNAVDERGAFKFSRRLDAQSAQLEDGFWQLNDLTEYLPNGEAEKHTTISFPTSLDRASLIDRFRPPTHVGFWDLPKHIQDADAIGINTSKLRMRYYGLLSTPIMFVAMAMMGALACLRLVRLGRTAPFIIFGAAGGISLYFVTQIGASLGTIGAIPPLVAALAPPIFAFLVCLALVAYNEDG